MLMQLTVLLLPVAATCGWFAGNRRHPHKPVAKDMVSLRRDYFRGLNYLINQQPDKAVDVFIKLLEVDSDTVETHLALGNLFRQRGEVDRAIRIHQNLIARPQLDRHHRMQALSALGQDYLRAGVLDRAERLFLELVEYGEEKEHSLQYLLHIYQQEKDWYKAIDTAKSLEAISDEPMQPIIAQYYCELAEQAQSYGRLSEAYQHLKRAQSIDKKCVRASLIRGKLDYKEGRYRDAINSYKKVKDQDPDYLSEIIPEMGKCYQEISAENKFIDYLRNALEQYPRISIVLALADYLQRHHDEGVAIEFLVSQFKKNPSLRCLSHLVGIYQSNSVGDTKEKLSMLQNFILLLLAERPVYQCSHCGYSGKTLFWHCPSCHHWRCVKPILGIEGK